MEGSIYLCCSFCNWSLSPSPSSSQLSSSPFFTGGMDPTEKLKMLFWPVYAEVSIFFWRIFAPLLLNNPDPCPRELGENKLPLNSPGLVEFPKRPFCSFVYEFRALASLANSSVSFALHILIFKTDYFRSEVVGCTPPPFSDFWIFFSYSFSSLSICYGLSLFALIRVQNKYIKQFDRSSCEWKNV